ncbi:hypothetical protein OV208_36380 [Corallococcus sp. bb12-1]|uniref:hypothetical protein n=1 Tax=Corallococcus sp. bb12-1 TaxID=2996784 RepID=UPI00226D6F3A|nr:hypothetical protein [Corallococcus sp. bb12-1]MCY1046839.1 hypothetical protein [Corallococcus sp. bb12-1]
MSLPRSHQNTSRRVLPRAIGSGKSDVTARNLLAAQSDPGTQPSAWDLLYGAMVTGLGVKPQSFQLLYPFMQWTWPTTNAGYTSSAQYDFLATIPQWSAVGQYNSSGATFDGAYQQFLNDLATYTPDPQLQARITASYNDLAQATNQYQTDYNQAVQTYNADPSVVGNVPNFTTWLASGAGLPYNIKIQADAENQSQAQANYVNLVKQARNPNLTQALTAAVNPAYYTKLQDPNLAGNPPVPLWSLGTTMQQWVNTVQGQGGTPGSISFSNSQSQFDLRNTWAQGSLSVGSWFWQVNVNGSWNRVTEFESDSSLQCTISFKAWDTIAINPGPWYSGVTQFKNGPFLTGYSAMPAEGMTNMFGEGGVVPVLKTGMLVGYQPTISVTVSQSTFNSFQEQWQASSGFSVGPFQFGGTTGGSQNAWTRSASGSTLTATSTSTVPLIFGVTVDTLP